LSTLRRFNIDLGITVPVELPTVVNLSLCIM